MPNWEYSRLKSHTYGDLEVVVNINGTIQDFDKSPTSVFQVINEMGAEGWELVAVSFLSPPAPNALDPAYGREFVLKRPR